MIPVRLAKLKFLVEEMEIARHLATHMPDAFYGRTLARHILIRGHDFTEHTRGLRKPLNLAGFDTRDFHRRKEAYADNFAEYFQVPRDRLGAHLQDFDFAKRLEFWNDIEISKISFFVDGAKEIYESLASLNAPGYVPYARPPELTDAALNDALLAFQRSKSDAPAVEIGVDPLAMARDNASAMLNFSPVHSRAGQLALVRRWVSMQTALLERLKAHPRIVRILKARLITDLVSFCDCLVTRNVSLGAPQQMDGLDKLVVAEGQSAAPITDFVAVSRFDAELQTARAIRDKIGAHLEIDDTYALESLLADLDVYDLNKGLSFYERACAAFIKLCHTIMFLRMYIVDGQRIYGVSAGSARAVPFSSETPTTAQRPLGPPVNDEEVYRQNLTRWLDGNETQRGDARQLFYNAFGGSESVEQIEEIETFGSGCSFGRHEYRKAHAFLATALAMDDLRDSDFAGILELILSCSGGAPYPLAEVLVRQGRNVTAFRQSLICYALGEIGSAPHASVTAYLNARAAMPQWGLRLPATLALFKTFIKSEGQLRFNNKSRTLADYESFVRGLTQSMSAPELLICSLAFASILSGRALSFYLQVFMGDYTALQARIEALCVPYLKDDAAGSKAKLLKQLIQTYDYVGVCLLLAVDLEHDLRKLLREGLLDSCTRGEVVAAAHDQASRHLAMCFYLKKEHARALEMARDIAARNPDLLNAQILVAQILADTPGAEQEAAQCIANIRHSYNLDAGNEAILVQAEQEMAKRIAGS